MDILTGDLQIHRRITLLWYITHLTAIHELKRRLGFEPRDYSEDVAQKLFSISEKDKESPEQMEA